MSTIASNRCLAFLEAYADRILGRFLHRSTILHPRDIEKCMCRAIDEGARVFMRTVYAPNHITLMVNPEDMREFLKYRDIFWQELNKTAREYIDNNLSLSGNAGGRILIRLMDYPELPKGQIACTAELLDNLPEETP